MEKITTNFAKFLMSSSTGDVLGGYAPKLEPNTLIGDIEKFLDSENKVE
jgi:glutathione peroxidase-family protein